MKLADWTALVALAPPGFRKSRLHGLSTAQRDGLAAQMHCHVLDACMAAGLRVQVVEAHGGMNADLARARAKVAGNVIVLSSDLPLLTGADIAALIAAAPAAAANRHGTGTNAVSLPAGFVFRFMFGPGSLEQHLRQGLGRVDRAALALDVDVMDDLKLACERGFAWQV
jgi:2-phospho-L-lactate guanylyltransferase